MLYTIPESHQVVTLVMVFFFISSKIVRQFLTNKLLSTATAARLTAAYFKHVSALGKL